MENYLYEDYLYHHGVKGMRWGVRRKQKVNQTSSPRLKNATPVNKNVKKAKSSANKRAMGEKFVKTLTSKKTREVIAATAAVASGALWIASVFLPGAGAIAANGAAAVSNMVAITAG